MATGTSRSSGREPGTIPPRPRRALPRIVWPILALVAVALVALTLVARLSSPARHTLVVASMPYWNIQRDTAVVLAHRHDINEASPWIYGLSPAGAIVPQYAPGQAAAVTADIGKLRRAGLRVVPTIANITGGRWSYPQTARMLHSATLRRLHIDSIVALVQRNGYAGIDIDYEELHAGDRQAFTSFITDLAAALHAHGKVLSVAVFPQIAGTSGSPANAAQDYAAIGKVADQVRIMGYNFHWANSAPGAVAPISWVRSVLSYAKGQMPGSKVVLGVPLFGYNWPDGSGQAQGVSWLQALRLSRQYNATAKYSKASQAPYFSYVTGARTHVVWFENAASSAAKFQAAKGSSVAGVYLWMYGYEDPGTWSALRASLPTSGPGASSTSTAVP